MLGRRNSESLRQVLLRRLLWPLIPLLVLGILLSYGLAQHAAVNAYDSGLLDDARDLAGQIELHDGRYFLNLPNAAAEMLAINNEDRVSFAIWMSSGELIAGDKSLVNLVHLPSKLEFDFQDINLSGRPYRTVVLKRAYDGVNIHVAVAQTVKGRSYLLREIFSSMLLLGAFLLTASIVVVVSAVRAGLQPVELLRNEISLRSTNDLKPLSEDSAPIELRPIIHGINELLEKLSISFASYRRFIADAAHQLRTPLAVLGTELEVNLAQPPADASILLNELLSTTQRTSHLANQLLSLARLEHTDDSVADKNPLNIMDAVQEVAADFVSRAARKFVEFEFAMEPSYIRGNSLLIRELLSNLFDNALRYSPDHGVIHVSLCAIQGSTELTIADEGPGVKEQEIGLLGTPFYQSPTSLPDGCGLGLAIVCEIIKIHHGSIEFHSESEIPGFRVRINFPGV